MNRLRQSGGLRISFFSFQDIITSVTGILILVTLMLSFSMQTGDPSEEQDPARAQADRLEKVERENQQIQERRIEASKLPDAAQVKAQVEAMRREREQVEELKKQSDAATQSLLKRTAEMKTVAALENESAALAAKLQGLREKLAVEKTNSNVIMMIPESDQARLSKEPVAIVVNGSTAAAQRLNGTGKQEVSIASNASLEPLLARLNPERDLLVFYFRPSGTKWFAGFRESARRRGFEVGYDAVEEQKEIVFNAP